jgi:phosphoglycerate dehydrogenase-like enzyme
MRILVSIFSPVAIWNIPEPFVETLRHTFPQHEFVRAASHGEVVARLDGVQVVFASEFRPRALDAAGALRWIHSPAAGVGNMLFPELVASGITITNSRGILAESIAEHVLAVSLALFRRLPTAFARQAARVWAQDELMTPAPRPIRGATIGIVGLGAIGSAVARLGRTIGMRVVATRRHDLTVPAIDRLYPAERLYDLLAEADVVVLAVPLTEDTRGLIGRSELRAMKRSAILVNVGRGKLVREADLADELARGTIAGAALDVFEHEPLDPASPLWTLPNVLLTPHAAGMRPDYWEAVVDLFERNLRRFEQGEPLLNVIDKAAGY